MYTIIQLQVEKQINFKNVQYKVSPSPSSAATRSAVITARISGEHSIFVIPTPRSCRPTLMACCLYKFGEMEDKQNFL